jgi:hypothetical protein
MHKLQRALLVIVTFHLCHYHDLTIKFKPKKKRERESCKYIPSEEKFANELVTRTTFDLEEYRRIRNAEAMTRRACQTRTQRNKQRATRKNTDSPACSELQHNENVERERERLDCVQDIYILQGFLTLHYK